MSTQTYGNVRGWNDTLNAATQVFNRMPKKARIWEADMGDNQETSKSRAGSGVCQGSLGGTSSLTTTSHKWGHKKRKKSMMMKLNDLRARVMLNDRDIKVMFQSYFLPQPSVIGTQRLCCYYDAVPATKTLNMPCYAFNLKSMPFNSYDNTGGTTSKLHWGVPFFRLSKIGEIYSWDPVQGSQLTYGKNGVNNVAWNNLLQCWQPIDIGAGLASDNMGVATYIPVSSEFKFMFYAPTMSTHQVVHIKHVKFNNAGIGPRRYGVNNTTGAYATTDSAPSQDLIDSGRLYWDNLLSTINHPLYRPHVPINSPEPMIKVLDHTKFTFDSNETGQNTDQKPARSIQYLSINHRPTMLKNANDSSYLDPSQQEFGVDPTKDVIGTQAMPGLSNCFTNSLCPSYEKDEWLLIYADTYGAITSLEDIALRDFVSFEFNCTSKFKYHDSLYNS